MGIVVSKQFSNLMTLKTEETLGADWEDVAVKCAFISKAVYYASKEKGKDIVTFSEILEWLEKHQYNVSDKTLVRKMLFILFSAGVINHHGDDPQIEGWEWQLK